MDLPFCVPGSFRRCHPPRGGYRTITPQEVHVGAVSAELGMKATCAEIPIKYQLTYNKESRRIKTTKLSAVVTREVEERIRRPDTRGRCSTICGLLHDG